MQRRVRSVNKLQQIFWKAAESHCFTYARKSNRQQIHVSTTQRGSLPRSAVHPLHHATKWQFITNVIEASKNDLLPNDPLTDPRRSYTVCLQRINHKGTVGAVSFCLCHCGGLVCLSRRQGTRQTEKWPSFFDRLTGRNAHSLTLAADVVALAVIAVAAGTRAEKLPSMHETWPIMRRLCIKVGRRTRTTGNAGNLF